MKKLGASIAASAILATALWAALGDSTPAPATPPGPATEAGPGPGACTFTEGQTMAFRVESSVVAYDDQGHRHPESDHFAAVMSSSVQRVFPGGATLTTAFSGVSLHQSLAEDDRVEQPITDTFTVDIAPDCHIQSYHFPKHWSEATRRLVTGVVSNRDLVLQAGATWTAKQEDAMGTYQSRYQREGSSIRRDKLFYEQGELESFGMKLRLDGATAEASFGPSGLERLQGTERIQMLVGKEIRADLEQTYRFIRNDAAFRAPAPAEQLLAADAFGQEAGTRQRPEVPTELAEARALFAQLAPGLSALNVANAHVLAALVAEHPSLLRELADLLDGDELDAAARSSVFWILELAGTDGARKELVEWLDGERPGDRMRAAVALSGADPSLETGRLLAEMHASDPDPSAASTSLMAMGSLAAEGDEELQGFVRETVHGALEDASNAQEQIGAIDAMANAADPSFLEPLRDQLSDPNPRVRRHAARAMSRLGNDARGDIMDGLAREEDARSAQWMAASLREMGPPRADELPWATTQLDTGSKGVRAELIHWLGGAKTPAAKALLAQQYRSEPSVELRRLIGTFLPASALQGS